MEIDDDTLIVYDTAAAYKHDRVLLQVVTFTGDVGVDLLAVGEAHTRNFTDCRVRLLGGGCVDTYTYATTLRTSVQRRRLTLVRQ